MDELSESELWELAASEDKEERANALFEIAWRMQESNRVAESISEAATAKLLFAEVNNNLGEAKSGFLEASAYYVTENYDGVLEVIDRIIELYRIYAGEIELADAIALQGRSLKALRRKVEAEAPLNAAMTLYESNERYTQAGIVALDLVELLGGENRQSEALIFARHALGIFQEGSDLVGVGRAHDRIAACLIDLGEMNTAVEHLREALRLFLYTSNEYYSAWGRYRLGWTLVSIGQNAEAIPLLEEASRWYKAQGRYEKAADADTQIAHALTNQGDEETARDLYKTARAVQAASNNEFEVALADGNIAASFARSGLFQEAIPIYRRLIEKGKELNDGYIVRAISTRLANSLFELNTFEAYEEALAILDTTNIDDWGDSLNDKVFQLHSYMKIHAALGQNDSAESYAKKIIDFGIEPGFLFELAGAYKTLGLIEFDRGNLNESNTLVAQAISLYLANGSDELARELSQRLMPNTNRPGTDVFLPENGLPNE